MPDLHGWISQQITEREAVAQACPPWPWTFDADADAVLAADGIQVADVFALSSQQLRATGIHIIANDPEAVLRRCAADRKILEIHSYGGGSFEPYSCNGCGSDSEWGPIVEHTNDCETLQALAEAYGITADELAHLDRPEAPPRTSAPGGKSALQVIDEFLGNYADSFDQALTDAAEARFLGDITAHKFIGLLPIAAELLPPTPLERALDTLRPHLRDQPLYRENRPSI
ncbi:DUF6221 family protein [Streptomyces xanthophaeus]|uniref:DUF6221 family protein n=1 Tax=Streptomyces xanthophaeus TaxID=67385 RepID=UPI0036D1653B